MTKEGLDIEDKGEKKKEVLGEKVEKILKEVLGEKVDNFLYLCERPPVTGGTCGNGVRASS
eukprot:7643101-Heterocapsa_arctica.AAC.1